MVCTVLQYEDASEDQVVYGDQGISAEEYEKAMYGDFTKTQSKEEDEVKCTVAQQANNSMMLERKRRRLKKTILIRNQTVIVRVTHLQVKRVQ